jgi:phosphotransferase system IIA component
MPQNNQQENRTSDSVVRVSSSQIQKHERSLATEIILAPYSAYQSAITAVEQGANKSDIKRIKFETLWDTTFD